MSLSRLEITIPQSFRESPRWWNANQDWLNALPSALETQCRRWDLQPDGAALHGSNAIALPVSHSTSKFILRMTPPGDLFERETKSLRFWNGQGTVQLLRVESMTGAMLLERLDTRRTLNDVPLSKAVPVIARLMRKLAIEIEDDIVPSTAELVSTRLDEFTAQWERIGWPFEKELLTQVLHVTSDLRTGGTCLAVNGDLHYGQVLAATREPWLVIDPILLRGDIEYDLARLLWTRLDEMVDDDEIINHFETVVQEARLDRSRAWRWVIFRATDYWLWGLENGLTYDPLRCEKLVRLFLKGLES